jgi:hypothetical protein
MRFVGDIPIGAVLAAIEARREQGKVKDEELSRFKFVRYEMSSGSGGDWRLECELC